MHMGCFISG